MEDIYEDEYFGAIVFGIGLLLMGIGKLFKRWFR
jgi:hypothetical protein